MLKIINIMFITNKSMGDVIGFSDVAQCFIIMGTYSGAVFLSDYAYRGFFTKHNFQESHYFSISIVFYVLSYNLYLIVNNSGSLPLPNRSLLIPDYDFFKKCGTLQLITK